MAQVHKKSIADAVTENSQKQYQAFQFHIDETNQTSRQNMLCSFNKY